MKNPEQENPWSAEDEREHFPTVMEWWASEIFFTTLDNKKNWSFKGSFTEWLKLSKQTGSSFIFTIFDLDDNKDISHYSRKETEKLDSKKDNFEVHYNDSFMKGRYPKYDFFFRDPEHEISLDFSYKAKALPHWIAQDVTNGWLPMNFGFFRYGFVPNGTITGNIKIGNKTSPIKGTGYFEHVWGNISYTSPLLYASGIKKTISNYAKLILWWLASRKPEIPKSLKFSTENNPMGYDWAWAVLDNGWSLFYGNILLWIMKGPVAGTVILTKDGKNYTEFANGHFEYKKIKYIKEYDFFYPTEISLTVKNDFEILQLDLCMTVDANEFLLKLTDKKNAFFICEGPGKVNGYYTDGEKRINLKGFCKLEPQRQVSRFGHNSLEIELTTPPEGLGVDVKCISHYFKKQIESSIHVVPKPYIKFFTKEIKKNEI